MSEHYKPSGIAGKYLALSVMLAAFGSTAASAQVTIDVAKVSCDQFALYKISDPDTIAVWLHGYYSGKRGNTVVEVAELKANGKKLRDYCLQHPKANLLQAVEELMKP